MCCPLLQVVSKESQQEEFVWGGGVMLTPAHRHIPQHSCTDSFRFFGVSCLKKGSGPLEVQASGFYRHPVRRGKGHNFENQTPGKYAWGGGLRGTC